MKLLIYKLNVTLIYNITICTFWDGHHPHKHSLNTIVEKLNKLGLQSDKITCKCTIFTNNSVTSPDLKPDDKFIIIHFMLYKNISFSIKFSRTCINTVKIFL